MAEKNKYWAGILYPENMVHDWRDRIGDLLQVPYCYCIHDKDSLEDSNEDRKTHVHVIFAYPNTTTYKNALNTFSRLSADGKNCISTCQAIMNIRHMYNYLIHDTEDCRKKHKHIYLPTERICGNNFDIGQFEQISSAEKLDMAIELCDVIELHSFTNFIDFYGYVRLNYDKTYFEVLKTHSGLFDRMIKGCYLKRVDGTN